MTHPQIVQATGEFHGQIREVVLGVTQRLFDHTCALGALACVALFVVGSFARGGSDTNAPDTSTARSAVSANLVGTWAYCSVTVNGQRTSGDNFLPTLELHADRTWVLGLYSGINSSGTYSVQGNQLRLTSYDGKPYADYSYQLSANGQKLNLVNTRDQGERIYAARDVTGHPDCS